MAVTWEAFEHGKAAFEKAVFVGEVETAEGDEGDLVGGLAGLEPVPATDANLNLSDDLLDDTDLTMTDSRSHINGLREWSVDLTLNYKETNVAFEMIRDAYLARENLWVMYIPNHDVEDPSVVSETDEGYIGRITVENMDHSGGVDDIESIDATFQSASTIHWTVASNIPVTAAG